MTHTVTNKRVAGPSAALSAVVALAVTLATQGAGASLMNGLSGTLFGTVPGISATGASVMVPAIHLTTTGAAMVSAGFTTLCIQSTNALLQTGDPGSALRDLGSKQNLKSLGISVASAGLYPFQMERLDLK